ncbi:ABC transporter permease [Namhaeicola litoreus]|uniref:ABC transporter permease n=1 Tax=Namhaeicola litoreus TaxID=1052145 RepID=A0ABW3Y826_9FLAO
MVDWKIILPIARTHLFSKIKQTTIAALGVTFGIAAYITLVSFMTGLNEMLDGLVLNRTPHVHIYNEIKPTKIQPIDILTGTENSMKIVHSIKPKLSEKKIYNALPILQYLEEKKEVKAAIPQVNTQIFYKAGSIDLGGTLSGIMPIKEADYFQFGDYIISGSVKDLIKNDIGILIGAGISKKMSLDIGDRVQISTINGDPFYLKIVGIYQSGIAEIDNVQSFVNLRTAQKMLQESSNYITDINVKMYDIEKSEHLSKQIEKQFNVTAIDVKTANAQFETGTNIRNIITYAVSVALLIVAGFGIYNILNMVIYEKMNDIAILKAIGFSGKDVQMIFMSQAVIIGLVGGILGLIIGFVMSRIIDRIPFETEALPTIKTFPVNFRVLYYIIGFSFALISTFFAGYFPSRKAKKVDPIKIIRGQ